MIARIKQIILFSACLLLGFAVLEAGAQQKTDTSQAIEALKLAQRANDLHQLNNLMSMHAWYHAAMMNDVELEKFWSKRDDVCWAQNSGYWVGPKSIKEYYGIPTDRKSTIGQFAWHTITSSVVEVAGDRQTAKGVWYTPGIIGGFRDGKGNFAWMFEKYGVDFIMEDGEWKIWHMHVYTDTAWPLAGTIEADGNIDEMMGSESDAMTDEETGDSGVANFDPSMMKSADILKQNYIEVSPTTEVMLVPRPPEPYETWSDTWSYTDPNEFEIFSGLYKEYKK